MGEYESPNDERLFEDCKQNALEALVVASCLPPLARQLIRATQ
jgi:heterodisulfide reductase subunit A-like polyferredoxin